MTNRDASDGGYQELALAIIDDDAAAVESALTKGADADARDAVWGSTPLIFAALLGRAEIARMLVAAGADVHASDSYGNRALTLVEIDWHTTEAIAKAQQIQLKDPDRHQEGKGRDRADDQGEFIAAKRQSPHMSLWI